MIIQPLPIPTYMQLCIVVYDEDAQASPSLLGLCLHHASGVRYEERPSLNPRGATGSCHSTTECSGAHHTCLRTQTQINCNGSGKRALQKSNFVDIYLQLNVVAVQYLLCSMCYQCVVY